jgi:hypothetical protein
MSARSSEDGRRRMGVGRPDWPGSGEAGAAAGFPTCGEIARTLGIDGFRNQTPAVPAFG